jgi:hypothetical protein
MPKAPEFVLRIRLPPIAAAPPELDEPETEARPLLFFSLNSEFDLDAANPRVNDAFIAMQRRAPVTVRSDHVSQSRHKLDCHSAMLVYSCRWNCWSGVNVSDSFNTACE